ncbi:neuropilin and tolloid-like protein 2, partial [Schistocerca nitens]|uniref:neuropilin and tolloid-like protein 2 n=1 Tax=Schistocerca nitens TaxID=7011 RepID=UPI002117D999
MWLRLAPAMERNSSGLTQAAPVIASAAGPGNVIRLEFREMFRLEPSEGCQFDFLEVRDGRYGYNDVLDRFCGHRVPPSGVMSSGRYMYLHFRSDDTIEYEGFAAVYMVLPRPTQMSPSPGPGPELSPCIIPVTGVEGYVNRSDIDRHCPERVNQSTLWHSPLEGMWVINVTVGWKIQLAFLVFKLDKPNDCNQNFVQVFKDNTDMPSRLSEFCGAKAETVLSENNVMHVRYWATSQAINATFDSLFTAYREGNKKPCLDDEFDCQDDTCISRTLRCNNRINCRFLWDEEKEECKKSVSMMKEILSSDHIIIILVIFCLILSGMCFAFLYNCTRKLVRDHRIIRRHSLQCVTSQICSGLQEHVRASREARLDAAGKSTPGGSSPRARSAPDDCYVPAAGGLLPMLLRDTPPDTQLPPPPPLNGDAVFLRDGRHRDGSSSSPRLFDDDDDEEDDDGMEQDEVDLCDFLAPQPETRDNECQTRESLFLTASVTTATSTTSPSS